MKLIIKSQANPETLARSAMIFLEHKLIVKAALISLNVLCIFLIAIIVLKSIVVGIPTLQECLAALFGATWLLLRKSFTHKLLTHKMRKNPILSQALNVTASLNGIVWQGEGLKAGNLSWNEIKKVYRTLNGYILPINPARFLWLPFSGFKKGDQEIFESTCEQKKVRIQSIKQLC